MYDAIVCKVRAGASQPVFSGRHHRSFQIDR